VVRTLARLLAALVATSLLLGCSGAGPGPDGALVVRGATVDLPLNDRQAVVRLIIDNRDGPADRLLGASSPAAEAATVHESMADDQDRSVMEERPSLEIPAGEQVFFSPGSYHVMLERLRRPLELGDEVEITLRFERAGAVVVVAPVTELPTN
jgi:periplasmic copper chaperone A